MIFLYLAVFIISFVITNSTNIRVRLRTKKFTNLKIVRDEVVCNSISQHSIKIDGAKWIYVDGIVHIFIGGRMIRVSGVTRVFEDRNHLYFTGTGVVKFCSKLDCIEYLKLDIDSSLVNVNRYRTLALAELIENLYNVDKCENLKKFLKLVKNTLKIRIFNRKITIFQNNFRFPYVLTYKTNDKTKKIFVNID